MKSLKESLLNESLKNRVSNWFRGKFNNARIKKQTIHIENGIDRNFDDGWGKATYTRPKYGTTAYKEKYLGMKLYEEMKAWCEKNLKNASEVDGEDPTDIWYVMDNEEEYETVAKYEELSDLIFDFARKNGMTNKVDKQENNMTYNSSTNVEFVDKNGCYFYISASLWLR